MPEKRIYNNAMTDSQYQPSPFQQRLSAAKLGNIEAASELLSAYRNYMRLLARLHVQPLLQSKFDASDIVQETCSQAAVAIQQFEGDSEAQFVAWLRRILANKGALLARNYLGAQRRDVTLECQLGDQFERSSNGIRQMAVSQIDSPSRQAIRKETAVALADAISRTTADQRDVLIMHGLEGKSIVDIATSMGRSEAAVWKIWARGLQAIRKQFEESA